MADYETVIIGAGRAGIGLAVALIGAGRDDLCILEQGQLPADSEQAVAEHDLRSFIRVGARVATASWDAKRQHWDIAVAGAQQLTARCLIAAWGRPDALPDVTGTPPTPLAATEALALPGFPNLLLLSATDPAAGTAFALAVAELLDEPGAIEATAPLAGALDPAGFTRIPVPEIVSIYH